MEKCIDAALRLFCSKDEVRPVQAHPFMWKDSVVATNGKTLLRVTGYDTMEYNNDDEKYGRRPNIDGIMKSEYNTDGYLRVDKLKDCVGDSTIIIGGHAVRTDNISLIIEASGLLGIDRWAVDTSCKPVVLHTDDGNIKILIMPLLLDTPLATVDLEQDGYSMVDESKAHKYLNEYEERLRIEQEEAKRKHDEYMANHHTIWKIYVKRTEVGVLLVDAPTYDDAMRIAERNRDDAEWGGDYDYEVDKDDYEEDVDHDEILDYYPDYSIATMEETKYGNKFIHVDDYEYFDK